MIFGFARIYLCKRLAKSELKLANWKLGFQFSSQKYGKTNTKEYLAKKKDISYNEDEVQKSQIPSGLCV